MYKDVKIYMYVFSMHILVDIHICLFTWKCILIDAHTHMYKQILINKQINKYTHIYIYTHMCMCFCTRLHFLLVSKPAAGCQYLQ